MFVSKSRSVVYPQFEHARLAGTLAQHWGNENFRHPELPFEAFFSGVALHDFGYGLLDRHDLLKMDASERRTTFEALTSMHIDDPIVEVVAKLHVARLLNMAGMAELEAECRQQVQLLIVKTGIREEVFANADTITRLCDTIAFDFCFEVPAAGSVTVCDSIESIEISYEIDFKHDDSSRNNEVAMGQISLDPWPLSCHQVKGYLFAYEQSGYPQILKPRLVQFRISPA